jgi:hypothetical protein
MAPKTLDILPDSRPRDTRGVVYRLGVAWIPIYCANCGKPGGKVPQDSGHAFYLCDSPCGEQWGRVAGTMAVPDEVFFARVAAEMGRAPELGDLADPDSVLTKLARERAKGI